MLTKIPTVLELVIDDKVHCYRLLNPSHSHVSQICLMRLFINYELMKDVCHSGLPRWLRGKESACQFRRLRRHRFNPWDRKIPEVGNGNLLWYSCWRIPWTEEPGRLQSIASQRFRHS